jgi:hypothetical protein
MATGLNTQIGYAVETVEGTFVPPVRFLEVLPPITLAKKPAYVMSRGIRANRAIAHAKALGTFMVDGSIGHELVAENIGVLGRAMWDPTPATSGAGTFTHIFTPSVTEAPAPLSIQQGLPSVTAVHPMSYAGMRVKTWTIRVTPGDVFATLTIEWAGKNLDSDGTPALTAATYPTFTRFLFTHGSLSIAGAEVCVDSFEITGDNGLDTEHKICLTDAGGPTNFYASTRKVTGTAVADFTDMTALNRYLNGTEAALSFAFNAGAAAQLTLAGNAMFPGEFPTVQDPGKTKMSIQFELLSPTSDAAAFTATLINSDASA